MFKIILKLIIQGRFKDAWDFYGFVGKEKLPVDFKDEDFKPYYSTTEMKYHKTDST